MKRPDHCCAENGADLANEFAAERARFFQQSEGDSTMAVLVCPTCGLRFHSEQSRAMPFCSPRCQQIDLGRWLNEAYSMPVEPELEPEPQEIED